MRSWNKFVTQVKTTVNCRSFKSMFNKGGQIHRKTCSNNLSLLELSRRDHCNARDVLFWPGMCKEIETMVEKCLTCQEYRNAQQKSLFDRMTYQYVHAKWLPQICSSAIIPTTCLWWIITATILRSRNLQVPKVQR